MGEIWQKKKKEPRKIFFSSLGDIWGTTRATQIKTLNIKMQQYIGKVIISAFLKSMGER